MYENVKLNKHGYYELKKMPTAKELADLYEKEYYQESSGPYQKKYSDDEIQLLVSKLEQKLLIFNTWFIRKGAEKTTMLDVGCGEGFAVKFFSDQGFEVTGLDYSSEGISNHNSSIKDKVVVGDIYNSILELEKKNKKYNIINIDNVLEHVLDPEKLLSDLTSKLLADDGILLIKVPNDFSIIQQYFYDKKIITGSKQWCSGIHHIQFFNQNGLTNLAKEAGLDKIVYYGNYLTELMVFNTNTNYYENPEVGKSCHLARVEMENFFHSISPAKSLELYKVLGDMGLGREIIGIYKKAK